MANQEILDCIHDLGEAQSAFRRSHEQKFDGLADRLDGLVERIEDIEARGKQPGKTAAAGSRDQREHAELFTKWLRDPRSEQRKRLLVEAESEIERKDVTIGSNAGGGYAVPEIIEREIEKRVSQLNPFRELVKTVQVGRADYKHLADIRGETVGWVGETGTRSKTDTPSLREIAPTFGTLYAYPQASEESVNDVMFDVQAWLIEDVGDSFASEEATAILSGNGTSKPTGVLNATPVTTTDDASPLRSADALMYVASSASPDAVLPDSLIDIAISSLKERYLMGDGVAWVMHRNTLGSVRKLKDDQGQYLWQSGLNSGPGGELLGYPVRTCDAVPTIGANANVAVFGNWRRGYLFAIVQGMRITVDDNITTPGYVKYYIRRRVGGRILNNDALRVLRTT